MSITANVREAVLHSLVIIDRVVAPLLEVSEDILAIGVDVDDLFVDGVGEVLEFPLAESFDAHLHQKVVHTGIMAVCEIVHVPGAGHVASPDIVMEHASVWCVCARRLRIICRRRCSRVRWGHLPWPTSEDYRP